MKPCAFLMVGLGVTGGCVPSEPTEKVHRTEESASSKPQKAVEKDKKVAPAPVSSGPKQPLLAVQFEDHFERTELGSDWRDTGTAWKIREGRLCAENAKNAGVWLQRRLPTNARIEFDAVSEEADIKAELWGDGRSSATSVSYTNATSYLTIWGGWKNTFHVLARIDEHAPDRLEVRTDQESIGERERPVVAGRTYGFRIERTDGKTVSWWVDGVLIHKLQDSSPLSGPGHEHIGFNNWLSPVCFDNVRVTPLPDAS